MNRAVIGLFHSIESARSAKIMLETLNIMNNDTEIILKDDYEEELDRLVSYGFSKEDLYDIDNGFKEGKIVLSVKPVNNYLEAFKLLSENQALSVFTSDKEKSDNQLNQDKVNLQETAKEMEILKEADDDTMKHSANNPDNSENKMENGSKIELREERLNISKKEIQKGEVIVRKEIIKEMKTIQVPIIREELVIEKRTVDHLGKGNTVEVERIPVMEEVVQVNKQKVVKEEVDVKKIQVQGTEVIEESLYKEELDILKKAYNKS